LCTKFIEDSSPRPILKETAREGDPREVFGREKVGK
jgi:hypothetical protein